MAEPFSEFDVITERAKRLGVEVLPVSRVGWTDREGATVSGLRWGEGPPEAVYLHGGGLHAHAWDATILTRGRPALALDLPGHGNSDWRDDFDYGPETLGARVADILVQSGDAPVTLVGHSLGGLAGIAAAAAAPARVRRLVVVDISPGREVTPSSRRLQEFFAGPESFASLDELLDRAIDFGIGTSRESLRRGMLLNTRVRADGRVEFKHHLARAPGGRRLDYDPSTLWRLFPAIDAPVLLVHGTKGVLTPAMVEEFLDRVPSASDVELEAGHDIHREAPRALGEAIDRWERAGQGATSRVAHLV